MYHHHTVKLFGVNSNFACLEFTDCTLAVWWQLQQWAAPKLIGEKTRCLTPLHLCLYVRTTLSIWSIAIDWLTEKCFYLAQMMRIFDDVVKRGSRWLESYATPPFSSTIGVVLAINETNHVLLEYLMVSLSINNKVLSLKGFK